MSMNCADIVDRLPDWVAGRLADTEAGGLADHVATCRDCAAETELLRSLVATRTSAPPELAQRIVSAALAERARAPQAAPRVGRARASFWRLAPAWGLPAAAVLVLAIGTTVVSHRSATVAQPDSTLSPVAAALADVPVDDDAGVESVSIADDGVVAGAPVLDQLSDDNLAALLQEMGG
jgi:anti-sigma factor RsiW